MTTPFKNNYALGLGVVAGPNGSKVISHSGGIEGFNTNVTYVTPDTAQVCTMDMAPRGAVAAVNDLEDDSDVQLVLTGGDFDNVKIPIYGTNS